VELEFDVWPVLVKQMISVRRDAVVAIISGAIIRTKSPPTLLAVVGNLKNEFSYELTEFLPDQPKLYQPVFELKVLTASLVTGLILLEHMVHNLIDQLSKDGSH
jgi:hypothetical protein